MSGMSREFMEWLVANDFCYGSGGEGCVHGRESCDTAHGCNISTLWPLITVQNFYGDNAEGKEVYRNTDVTLQCMRHQDWKVGPVGPPFTVMVTKPLKVPMAPDVWGAYQLEYQQRLDATELQELKERIAKVIDLCETTRDVDLDALPNQIVRILRGENCAA